MTKFLVVDDEEDLEILIKQKFRQKIRDQQYEFFFAVNGRHALEQLEANPDIEIVLSDINMPEMDGLTLLTKLSEKHQLLKAVIISAYGDMDNIRTAMNRGAFDFITKPVNFDDLHLTMEKTIKQVKQLRDTLAAIKENNILRMYVDETVLNFMGSKDFESSLVENEIIDATVVFIDICGFTSISENEPPDKVVTMLNTFFDVMVKEIINQNGIVDKFMGDCIMSVFKGKFHEDRAIEASLNIRNKLNRLQTNGDNSSQIKVSIGINSGEMVSGNIGSSTLRRLDFTVIGDTVNTAQRLQSIAGANQILINEETYEKVKESFKCEKVGESFLKNKVKPVTVYEVLE
jgi:adenylate cyclase